MFYIHNQSVTNSINKMKQAKRNFFVFEEALVKVRWAQAGLIPDLLLDNMTEQFLKKCRGL